MKKAVSSAPGKVIISGEHSVVYGKAALAAALSLRTTAEVSLLKETNTVNLSSDKFGEKTLSLRELREYWQRVKAAVRQFDETGRSAELKRLRADKFAVMLGAASSELEENSDFSGGLRIRVRSQLPAISGFGASAYVAAGIIGSLGKLFGKAWSLEELNRRTYETERVMHGKPSGVDSTTVIYGGVIRFKKNKEKFRFRQLILDQKINWKNVWLVNSGRAEESTGEMVEMVSEKRRRQRQKYNKLIDKIGEITEGFIRAFEKGEFAEELIRENQRRLEELGVVGEQAKAIIEKIEKCGGSAKISGAGGVKTGSGLVLAYQDDFESMGELIKKEGWQSSKAEIGGRGWQKE